MSRTRVAVPVAILCVALLGGCSTAQQSSSTPTDEAIVGGLETVAPDAYGRTTLGVVDAIEAAGTYECEENASGWECTADGSAGAITVVGAEEEEPTVSGAAPIDGDTVAAIAEVLAATPDQIYSADAGLAWPTQ